MTDDQELSASMLKYYDILLFGVQKQECIEGKMVWVTHYDGKRYIKHDMTRPEDFEINKGTKNR